MRGPLTVFTSLLVAAVVALSTGAAGADPSGRSNDPQTLLTWNSVAVSTLATAKLPPPEQWLYTAYVQSAVYDAVVAIDRRAPEYRLHLHASHPASTDAAIAAAAHDILVAYFPGSHRRSTARTGRRSHSSRTAPQRPRASLSVSRLPRASSPCAPATG